MSDTKSGNNPDPRPTDELIRAALSVDNEDTYMEHVEMLRYRGTEEVFDKAISLCASENPHERELGADILGTRAGAYEEKFIEVLTPLLQDESPQVLVAATVSLAILKAISATEPILKLSNHPDAGVRRAVAYAIGWFQLEELSAYLLDEVTDTLISLSSDADTKVRLEATESLVFAPHNVNAVVGALLNRVSDDNAEIRGKALFRLADEGYPQIVELIIHELSTGEYVYDDTLYAARLTADPRLLPTLLELKEDGIESQYLGLAIEECSEGGKFGPSR